MKQWRMQSIRRQHLVGGQVGEVSRSSWVRKRIACALDAPHISFDGINWEHTAGRSGWPKSWHRLSSSSCTHRTPAGLPCGMPGIGELIEGAMQQAPQPGRQFMDAAARPPTGPGR